MNVHLGETRYEKREVMFDKDEEWIPIINRTTISSREKSLFKYLYF